MKEMIIKIALFAVCALTFAGLTEAQDNKAAEPQPNTQQPTPSEPRNGQMDLFRQLGLSEEQIQQIRHVKMEQRPLMEEAQRHFREANRALDEAIYADQINDADFQARLKDVQLAQAEVQRLRFMNELAVRRILTPEQLVRFREMRERFEQARQNRQDRRQFPDRNMRPMERPMFRKEKPADQPARPIKSQPQKPVQ